MSEPTSDFDLPRLVRRGVGAVFAAQIASQVISLVTLGCLARLVAPEAFGVIGVALPIVMLPRMAASLGFGTSATVTAEEDTAVLAALFWRTLLWSMAAAVVTACFGLILSRIYELPSLQAVAPVLGLSTIFNSLSVVHLAVLERRMQLPTSSLIRLVAQAIAAVSAVVAAWSGWQVWSLVLQHALELAILAPLAWFATRWMPSIRHFRLAPEASRFGGYYAAATLLFYAAQNIDKLLLALWLGSSAHGQALLGMYSQAYNLAMRPVYSVTTPVWSVMLPTLVRVQQDTAERSYWTERFYRLTALLLFPAGVGLWLVADDVMKVLAPDWQQGGSFLAAFAPLVAVQGLITIAGSLLASVRRSDLLCFAAAVQVVLLAQAAWGGASFAASDYEFTATAIAPQEGQLQLALGTAYGVTVATTFSILVPYILFVLYIADVHATRFFAAVGGPLLASLAMGTAVFLLRRHLLPDDISPTPRLVASATCGLVAYALFSWPIWRTFRPRPESS